MLSRARVIQWLEVEWMICFQDGSLKWLLLEQNDQKKQQDGSLDVFYNSTLMAHSINYTISFWLQKSSWFNLGKDYGMVKIPGGRDHWVLSWRLPPTSDYNINYLGHNQNQFEKQTMQLLASKVFSFKINSYHV